MADKKKISIYGSCVTRDIFSVLDIDEHVGTYIARSSLISRMAEPVASPPDFGMLTSSFQRRMVEHDFRKTGLELEPGAVLAMDFIDERFPVVCWGDTLVTFSRELRRTGLGHQHGAGIAFERGTQNDFDRWRVACEQFADFVRRNALRVLLHEAYHAERSSQPHDEVNDEWRAAAETHNRSLREYHRIFCAEVEPKVVIRPAAELVVADPDHQWGPAPFHYVRGYYEDAWNQLRTWLASQQS